MKHFTKTLNLLIALVLFMGCEKTSYPDNEGSNPEPGLNETKIAFTVNKQKTKTTQGNSQEITTVSNNGNIVEISDINHAKQETKGSIVTSVTISEFGLFGYSTVLNKWSTISEPNLFYNTQITKIKDWKTDKDWASGNNSFFAYSPSASATNGITIKTLETTEGVPIIKYVTPILTANQPYILVAAALDQEKSTDNKAVPLSFESKLTTIGFRVVNAFESKITGITLTEIKTTGELKIDNDPNWTSDWTTEWVIDKATATLTPTINADILADKYAEISEADLITDNGTLMVIPQPVHGNSSIRVTFIDDNNAPQSIEIALIDYVSELQMGKHYTFVIDAKIPAPHPPIVESYNPANCIMTAPRSEVSFYAHQIGKTLTSKLDVYSPHLEGAKSYGLEVVDGDFTYVIIKPASVKVKWQTSHGRTELTGKQTMLIASDGIIYDKKTGKCDIKINAAPKGMTASGGSAYVCAYGLPNTDNPDGTILWSWHIWVTGNEVTTFNTVTGSIMQDRALGAITTDNTVGSYGMLYQWGRKDPFTPGSEVTIQHETQLFDADGTELAKGIRGIGGEFTLDRTTITTITDLVKNPSTYYDNIDEVSIGSTGNLDKDWWNPTMKNLYDPCPAGYRVPASGVYGTAAQLHNWSAYINADSPLTPGVTWTVPDLTQPTFFPASGDRTFGLLGFSGSCNYWVSTPAGFYSGIYLNITSSDIVLNTACTRDCAVSIRCVVE